MQKNIAGQKWIVFAFDRTDNTPKMGDATNITANLRLDGGAANAVDDVNPTELEGGFYVFDITQAETNANMIVIAPQSSTADIQVIGVPGVYDTTPPNFVVMGIESDGDLTRCNNNTDMRGTNSAALASVCTETRLVELAAANMPADIDAILTDTSTTLDALIKRVLGLSQENHYIDNTTFTTGKLTAARIRIYSVAGSVGTAADVIATYNITATYDANGNLETYKVVKA